MKSRSPKYKLVFSDITPKTEKEDLYTKKCYLGVSLNNQFFYGPHTRLLLKWMAKRFPSGIVVIGDYLNRYNEQKHASGLSDAAAIKKCLNLGKQLREVFTKHLDEEGIKTIEIFQWQEFSEVCRAKEYVAALQDEIKHNGSFNQSIQLSIDSYLSRNFGSKDNDLMRASSRQYILEELGVFSHLIDLDYLVQVYPGTQLDILKKVSSGAVKLDSCNLKNGIYVDLSVKKIK